MVWPRCASGYFLKVPRKKKKINAEFKTYLHEQLLGKYFIERCVRAKLGKYSNGKNKQYNKGGAVYMARANLDFPSSFPY